MNAEVIINEETIEAGETAFNVSAVDPEGRIYGSQMAKSDSEGKVLRAGCIKRIDAEGSHHVVAEHIGAPNGIIISGDNRVVYVADNSEGQILAFDYDQSSGDLVNRRVFATVAEGTPDGMAVDAEGNLWVTHCGGGCVACYDGDGKQVTSVKFPTKAITACAFGGRDLDTLYVTSLGAVWRSPEDQLMGCVFALRPGVCGREPYRSRIHP